jgi:THO complex subunit 5
MAVETVVVDPSLQPLLKTTNAALAQTQAILDWIEDNATSSEPLADLQHELAKKQKLLHVYLAKLRGLHRQSVFGVRTTKQQTAEARQDLDRLLLQLQNLYYEQKHLLGEISACEDYDHSYMRLPLIPHDEYIALFPDQAGLSDEELMPRRIEHEKQEREKMEEERLRLVKIKDELLKENTRRKDELKKMDEKLEAMIDGMLPLQEALAKDL